jgi:hypothetical protein
MSLKMPGMTEENHENLRTIVVPAENRTGQFPDEDDEC